MGKAPVWLTPPYGREVDDLKISLPVVEEIAKTGKLIAFHCGVDACERTHPFRIAKIARRFSRVDVPCAHMGRSVAPT